MESLILAGQLGATSTVILQALGYEEVRNITYFFQLDWQDPIKLVRLFRQT